MSRFVAVNPFATLMRIQPRASYRRVLPDHRLATLVLKIDTIPKPDGLGCLH